MRSCRRSLCCCEVVKYIVKYCRAPPVLPGTVNEEKEKTNGGYYNVLSEFKSRGKGSV